MVVVCVLIDESSSLVLDTTWILRVYQDLLFVIGVYIQY